MIRFSVLTCRLRDRPGSVLDKLIALADPHPDVEVLWLGDNRRRSIGLKRQALLDVAQGCYVATIDDDDDVRDDYFERLLSVLRTGEAPVVTFDALVKYQSGSPDCYVECAVGYPNEQAVPGRRIKRAAWPFHAWRRDIAQTSTYPDSMNGEDWEWAKGIQPTELCPHIQEPLYFYRERA